MIRIELGYLVVVYLLAVLALVAFFWLAYESRRQLRLLRSRRHLIRCGTCHGIYRDETNQPTPACPHCGSLNERERVHKI